MTAVTTLEPGVELLAAPDSVGTFEQFQQEHLAMIAQAFGCCTLDDMRKQLHRPSFEEILDQIIGEKRRMVEWQLGPLPLTAEDAERLRRCPGKAEPL